MARSTPHITSQYEATEKALLYYYKRELNIKASEVVEL
jgi:hypothetical protein